jgi:dTDP-4-dehydrorhamnose reductase
MIWVIGSKGMLGTELCRQLDKAGLSYAGTDLDTDILDPKALKEFADRSNSENPGDTIDTIVNCSAYTAVDQAEDETEKAFAVNAQGAANIADTARDLDAFLIHISTDYVFPGTEDRALTEEDAPGPKSAYGRSKLAGEDEIRKRRGKHVIIRTSWLYGKYGKNFVLTMLKLMGERRELRVVNDQFGSPTNAADLAAAVITIIQAKEKEYGVFHFSGTGRTTWCDFARKIAELGRRHGILGGDTGVTGVSTSEYPTKAVRPAFSLLSTEKISRVYHITPPEWRESLARFLKDFAEGVKKDERT